jgi:PadR family transcriptional regulator, regulatory protein AphA
MKLINPTGFAILGLIAAQEGSAYELAQRMKSNYRFFWPRAQSHFYSSVKSLVAAGLATASDEARGRRHRTVYRATAHGIEALASWLKSPAKAPTFEFEGLLRVAYADFGDKPALLAQLETIREGARATLAIGVAIARAYDEGRVDLSERAHTAQLLWQFLWALHQAIAEWAEWATSEVEAWPDTTPNPVASAQSTAFFAKAAQFVPRRVRRVLAHTGTE